MNRATAAFVIAVVVFGALFALLRTDLGQALLGRWSFVEWARVDKGTYFRLKVQLAYKVEPQNFDIVTSTPFATRTEARPTKRG